MTRHPLEDAFRHNAWATVRLIDACAALTHEQLATDVPGTYGSIHRTLHHLVDSDTWYLSFFRDEAAIAAWRKTEEHRRAQGAGRSEIFANYRLRVTSVIRDYGMHDREQAPADSQALHG